MSDHAPSFSIYRKRCPPPQPAQPEAPACAVLVLCLIFRLSLAVITLKNIEGVEGTVDGDTADVRLTRAMYGY
jgi:hypothetical protein